MGTGLELASASILAELPAMCTSRAAGPPLKTQLSHLLRGITGHWVWDNVLSVTHSRCSLSKTWGNFLLLGTLPRLWWWPMGEATKTIANQSPMYYWHVESFTDYDGNTFSLHEGGYAAMSVWHMQVGRCRVLLLIMTFTSTATSQAATSTGPILKTLTMRFWENGLLSQAIQLRGNSKLCNCPTNISWPNICLLGFMENYLAVSTRNNYPFVFLARLPTLYDTFYFLTCMNAVAFDHMSSLIQGYKDLGCRPPEWPCLAWCMAHRSSWEDLTWNFPKRSWTKPPVTYLYIHGQIYTSAGCVLNQAEVLFLNLFWPNEVRVWSHNGIKFPSYSTPLKYSSPQTHTFTRKKRKCSCLNLASPIKNILGSPGGSAV